MGESRTFLNLQSEDDELELNNEILSNDVTSKFKLLVEPHPEELLSLKILEKTRKSEER